MHFVFKILFLLASTVIDGIGILTSAFIVAVNLLDLAKHRGMNTCDAILVTMAISSTFCHCTHQAEIYDDMFSSDVHGMDYGTLFLRIFSLFTLSSTSWCTSWLCIYYCVKIVDFKNPIFFWLKTRINKAVPWLLIGSGFGILTYSFSVCWKSYGNILQGLTNITGNHTAAIAEVKHSGFERILSWLLLIGLPILLDIVSITLILTSLCRHTQRMKDNASGFSQPRLQVHFAAAKMVGAFLLLDAVFLLSECLLFMCRVVWLKYILEILVSIITPAQTVTLILGNSKLKEALRKLLSHCKKKFTS